MRQTQTMLFAFFIQRTFYIEKRIGSAGTGTGVAKNK